MRSDSIILLVSGEPEESFAFQRILWECVHVRMVSDLAGLERDLGSNAVADAVLCAWRVGSGTWKDALSAVLARCPDVPVIVFSRTASEPEWVEVLDAGAFDLLTAPYLERRVLPVLEHAVSTHDVRRMQNVLPFFQSAGSGGG